jgi:hypothetical protein
MLRAILTLTPLVLRTGPFGTRLAVTCRAGATVIVARWTTIAVTPLLARALRGESGGDQLVVVLTRSTDDLDPLGLLAGTLGSENADDDDAVHHEIGVGTNDVADLGSLVQQRSLKVALRELGPGSAPGPDAIFSGTG